MASFQRIHLTSKGFTWAKSGHPWVFRSDISNAGGAAAGDIVRVIGPSGRELGLAFFNPASQIALRWLNMPVDADVLAKLRENLARAIARRVECEQFGDAYRLVFSESDWLPGLVVDRYADVLVIQITSVGMEKFRDHIVECLRELCAPAAIVERNDLSVREREGLPQSKSVLWGRLPSELLYREGDVCFGVDVLQGQKTGAYLDQRENHIASRSYARGRALDAFCCNGGFALHLARSCDQVLALDSSQPALDALAENMRRNDIENIRTVCANAFDWMRAAVKSGERFDTIVLDPPPMARDRKSLPRALAGYKELNLRAMQLSAKDGTLITCSCSQAVDDTAFSEMLLAAAADAGRTVQLLERRMQGRDHPMRMTSPESYYLKCWVLRVC